MKIHFEPGLEHQLAAIEAVCDLFQGQELCRTEFTVVCPVLGGGRLGFVENDKGVGNLLALTDEEILANLRRVQMNNGIEMAEQLATKDFTVEMETGTGKTYVYLRTVFELNRRYGFTKFVVVVPSVAIKEGVYKTIQMTQEHFRSLYAGEPFDAFVYDSKKLGQVRQFATSSKIQIMVVTVGAINKKDVNNLYKQSEKTGGDRPIELIQATRPVLIVDEPQSVDGGLQGEGRAALMAMQPLCTLRYSATHADEHNRVYRLDAVDAYERRLVKQIEVASATVEDSQNRAYVKVVGVKATKGLLKAKLELDVETGRKVTRNVVEVGDGVDLEFVTGRALYENHRVGELRAGKQDAFVELQTPDGAHFLKVGEAFGEVDAWLMHRQMIRRTIREHLEKAKRLEPKGIKVLSLFFIDRVEHYRKFNEAGEAEKGAFALIFEEEYLRAAKHPDFRSMFEGVDLNEAVLKAHEGYFSIDRKRVGQRMVEVYKDTTGKTAEDDDTYRLIMKDKERLLSLETPLRFIFSHSALREGWDNPNVFQICALREMQSEQERRQTIGRGLRLCVNQSGERVHGHEVNTLTVVARESYEEFAKNLQVEIEKATGRVFGVIERHEFSRIGFITESGKVEQLGQEKSGLIWDYLKSKGWINGSGKIQESLRDLLREGRVPLPADFAIQQGAVTIILKQYAGRLEVKDSAERRVVKVRREVLLGDDFKQLWERIKHKTTYRVEFDDESLIRQCVDGLKSGPEVGNAFIEWQKASIHHSRAGLEAQSMNGADTVPITDEEVDLPDVLGVIQERTQLTRQSICRILLESGRLDQFKRNPQKFIEFTSEVLNRCKRLALVDGIKYHKLGDSVYYAQELFESKELSGYLNHMIEATKSVYEYVVYDSEGTEKSFARQLEDNKAVKIYAKLPKWFEIPTPLGTYNPDWALLVDTHDGERLYFVVETKSTNFEDELRLSEKAKIKCGEAHFKAIGTDKKPAKFKKAKKLNDVLS